MSYAPAGMTERRTFPDLSEAVYYLHLPGTNELREQGMAVIVHNRDGSYSVWISDVTP